MNFTATLTLTDGSVQRNPTRTLKHAEAYLAFIVNAKVANVTITNRKGETVRSAS